jgi:uncharacterized protein
MKPSRPPTLERRKEVPGMEYRRFGKTQKALSVITLGGMRYIDGWSKPREEPHRAMIDQAKRCLGRALELGINHIETAYGYSKSEYAYGAAFRELGVPRDRYFLMTKGDPESAEATHRMIEEQLKGLGVDKIDLYGYHGVNNAARRDVALKAGGAVETLLRYKEQGVIGNLGFSSHAPLSVLCSTIESGLFDFVNLHYYYFFQRNLAAIQLAEARDMGVFIISPNDKGGQLWNASQTVRDATKPLSPIQWNARFCLRLPAVHTLSFGMTELDHFEEMRGLFPTSIPLAKDDLVVQARLDSLLVRDPISAYEGYEFEGDSSGINIPEVLRFRRMLKCYDMESFARYRYNMFEEKGHWFPGYYATPERVAEVSAARAPHGVPIAELLNEAHAALYRPKAGPAK